MTWEWRIISARRRFCLCPPRADDLPPISHPVITGVSRSDPTRLTKPKSVEDFRLRGSVCAGITGRFVVSVAQVSASSNAVDGLWYSPTNPVVVVLGKVGDALRLPRQSHRRLFHGCTEQRTPPGCNHPKLSEDGSCCSLFARGATCGECRSGCQGAPYIVEGAEPARVHPV